MTDDDLLRFIEKRSKPGDWTKGVVLGAHNIRHAKTRQCPICWVASQMGLNQRRYTDLFVDLIGPMGLPEYDACLVANAADCEGVELRPRLLQACHIEEAKRC